MRVLHAVRWLSLSALVLALVGWLIAVGPAIAECPKGEARRELTNLRRAGILTGHQDLVLALAFSPDGKLLASGSKDGTVRLWDVATLADRHVFKGHTGMVSAVAFSPDGRTLASGGDDKMVRVWSVATRQELSAWAAHEFPVTDLEFSPDGKVLASASGDQTVALWETTSFKLQARIGDLFRTVNDLSFSASGEQLFLALGLITGGAACVNVKTLEVIVRPQQNEPAAYSLAVSPFGNRVAVGGVDIALIQPDGRGVRVLRGHDGIITALAYVQGDDLLLSTGADKTIRLWDVRCGTQLWKRECASPVSAAAFSPATGQCATASQQHAIELWHFVPPNSE